MPPRVTKRKAIDVEAESFVDKIEIETTSKRNTKHTEVTIIIEHCKSW